MDKHIEIWNIARKLKLGTDFYVKLDTLLTKIESDNQQLILQNVTNRLTGGDSWYKSSLKGIIETQIRLVEKGAQKNIDRKLILQWVVANL